MLTVLLALIFAYIIGVYYNQVAIILSMVYNLPLFIMCIIRKFDFQLSRRKIKEDKVDLLGLYRASKKRLYYLIAQEQLTESVISTAVFLLGESMSNVFRKSDPIEVYVTKETRDLPQHEQVQFQLRRLKAVEKAKIEDEMLAVSQEGLTGLRQSTVRVKMTIARLCGWQIPGSNVRFDTKDPEAMFDLLSDEMQEELVAHVNPSSDKDEPAKAPAQE